MAQKDTNTKMEDIISLCKRRGFIFQGSEIYGGMAGTWDYGPLGNTLKKNIEHLWWRQFVDDRDDMYGIDSAILMNPKVWEASGHVSGFSDPLVECQNEKCKNRRHRVDHLVSPDIYAKILSRLNSPDTINSLVSRTTKEISEEMPADAKESFP